MNEDLTEQMLKAMEARIQNFKVDSPLPGIEAFITNTREEYETMKLYQELIQKQHAEQHRREFWNAYYQTIATWYRWLIVDTSVSLVAPRISDRRYKYEPAWLTRSIRHCLPEYSLELVLERAFQSPCPFENFGRSKISIPQGLGDDEAFKGSVKQLSDLARQQNTTLSTFT